jgi:CBS domain-containing protein
VEEDAIQVREIMVPDPVVLAPDASLREAASKMRAIDSGVMPIGENDRLVGMLTDRDITIRATAEGKDPERTPVREVMSGEVVYCFEDEDIEAAARRWRSTRSGV